MAVFDSVNPENRALTNLTVTVTRNDVRPRFLANDRSTSILEITSVGSVVATVEATEAAESGPLSCSLDDPVSNCNRFTSSGMQMPEFKL